MTSSLRSSGTAEVLQSLCYSAALRIFSAINLHWFLPFGYLTTLDTWRREWIGRKSISWLLPNYKHPFKRAISVDTTLQEVRRNLFPSPHVGTERRNPVLKNPERIFLCQK